MSWHKLARKADSSEIISAPVLMLIALGVIGVIGWQEIYLMDQQRDPIQITIDLERDDVTEIDDKNNIADVVKLAVTAFIAEFSENTIEETTIRTSPYFTEMEDNNKEKFISFTGQELARQRRFDEAVGILGLLPDAQLIENGGSFAYGLSLSRIDRDKEALKIYEAHYKAYPEHQANAINYGLMLAQFDRHEEAIKILGHAARISSGSRRGKALSAQATAMTALNRYEEAIGLFKRSIEYRPGYSNTWRKLAGTYQKSPSASQQGIIAAYTKAGALAPKRYEATYDLANYLFSIGRFREAIPYYVKAHSLAKDRFDIMFNRALNLHISGRPSSSKRIIRTLVKQGISGKQKTQTALFLAIIERDQKNIKSFTLKLEKFRDKNNPKNKYLLFLSALEEKKYKKAREILENTSKKSEFLLPMNYAIGRTFYHQKKYKAAFEIFRAISHESASSALFRYDYSRSLVKVGKTDEALSEAAEAYRLEPKSKRISLEYSKQLLSHDLPENASAVLENLIEVYPNYSRALLQLAEIYTATGDNSSALTQLKRALELDSEDIEIALKLIKAHMTLEQYTEASLQTDEILYIDSGLLEARMYRVEILKKLGNMDEYYIEIDRILSLNPKYEPALKLKSL